MIRRASEFPEGFEVRTDVCVVGSGAGGGVATGVLAELGREVLVLEEGPSVTAADLNQREEQMYPLLYRDGGNQLTADGGITVVQGRVVGGSTMVNMADVVPMHREVVEHWQRDFGVDRYSPERVLEVGEACARSLGANPILEASLNRNNALMLEGARKLGLSTGVFRHNRVNCVGAGACMIGCSFDAKRSIAHTWIPDAIATGRVTVQADARVERFEVSGGRVTAAVGHLVRQQDQAPLAPFRVEAERFVLAAGTIYSPVILLASGLGGTQVGHNLSLQPQTPVAAVMPDLVRGFRGVPQATFVDDGETITATGGLGGFRLESIFATPAMTAATWGMHGPQVHALMTRYQDTVGCLCLAPDRPRGQVTRLDNGRAKITYTPDPAWAKTLVEAVRTAARVYLAAGAELVLLPFAGTTPARSEADLDQLQRVEIRANSLPLLAPHPQGTCRMGPDPATSVVGLDLRVHGVENLQVLDASVFPTSASSHTMIPVMTFAWLGAAEAI